MIELSQIRLRCGSEPQQLEDRIRRILRLNKGEKLNWRIVRHAVDARRKPELFDVYSVRVTLPGDSAESAAREKAILRRAQGRGLPDIRSCTTERYSFPLPAQEGRTVRPVIVGFGPAGMFCALMLSRAGYCPVVLERGRRMEERVASVERFWESGCLDPESNIQFGEGGAGTFSDGKLNSNVTDRSGRVEEVLRTFVRLGAPEDILYEQIPHIGTDFLRIVIRNFREEILSFGGEIHFGTRVTGLLIREGCVTGVRYQRNDADPESFCTLMSNAVVLAPGHSARDTIRALRREGVPMEAKPFALGMRISHPQSLIDAARYGIAGPGERSRLRLQPAAYKLTARAPDGRGVYSFCMCPGGYVVNASSEQKRLAVNGMSNYKRDAARANSAIVMNVSQRDFPGGADPVLRGMMLQERLEEKAYALGRGHIPVQRFSSFVSGVPDNDLPSSEELCIKGRSAPGALHELLPHGLTEDFVYGVHTFGRSISGFDGPEAYVIGLESRTSSPVRILRDKNGESLLRGLYPCGEGAGYAGGITSAAVDGIRTAEQIARRFRPCGTGTAKAQAAREQAGGARAGLQTASGGCGNAFLSGHVHTG